MPLFITVWEDAQEVAVGDPIQEEAVSIGGASLRSNPISSGLSGAGSRKRVRLMPSGDCYVTWGDNPIAVGDGSEGRAMGTDNPEYFEIKSGQIIAVIERV